MKLDRNIKANGRGKYALLKLRKLDEFIEVGDPFQEVAKPIADAIEMLERAGIIDYGDVETESEFMVIRLKDENAKPALLAYAECAELRGDTEYATDIREMAGRAGSDSPWCKKPD